MDYNAADVCDGNDGEKIVLPIRRTQALSSALYGNNAESFLVQVSNFFIFFIKYEGDPIGT